MSRALLPQQRLRRRPEFLKVQRQGTKTRGRYITLLMLRNDLGISRLGIVATRRLGNATKRNRSKRLVREIFRLNKGRPGFDLVVIPRPGFFNVPLVTLQADYCAALQRCERAHR